MKKLTLRQTVARLPCVCCDPPLPMDMDWILENMDIAPVISDPHHVTSVGAGGRDTPENLMSLCRYHHNEVEGVNGGLFRMIDKYPRLKIWLELAGRTDILEKSVAKRSRA